MFIAKLTPQGFLSFAPDFPGIELGALNLLIGPNGSGKSNLLEVLAAYRNMPKGRILPSIPGGTVADWFWRGREEKEFFLSIHFSKFISESSDFHHLIGAVKIGQSYHVDNERLFKKTNSTDENWEVLILRDEDAVYIINQPEEKLTKSININDEKDKSVLFFTKNVAPLYGIPYFLSNIRIYSDWSIGRNAPIRKPQAADAEADFLAEDFSNFGVVLNLIKDYPDARRNLVKYLKFLHPGIVDFDVRVVAGFVQIIIEEERLGRIPATRLSDGTLRYLALLTILCHPKPPPLVALEEPELGLHPDVVMRLGGLLREASERTQLVVTTHSELLIDTFSDNPGCVIACDKHDGGTVMNRLDGESLKKWLDDYSLGQLWAGGHFGANA